MAISFFGLALFLFFTLDSDYTATPVSAASEGVQITYGSTIKLMHERTKFRLHSHDVPYGSGSGQQSVTGFPGVDDANSYWIVRSTDSSKQGDPIKSGSIIRLQHMKTRRWLHSHLHASPISGNMELKLVGGQFCRSAALVMTMNLILGTIGDLKLRAMGNLGGKTKESGFNMWTLVVISTAMTRNTPGLLEVSKRFAVLKKNVQIMFG